MEKTAHLGLYGNNDRMIDEFEWITKGAVLV
jgi:hypothetical protein